MLSNSQLGSKGVVFFAMHRGAGDFNTIASVAFQKKWPFPVYNSARVKGNDQNTNPQTFIFDHEGNLAFDSRYETDGDKAVIKLATRSPDWLVGKIMKKAKSQAKKIASRKDMGAVMVELEEMAKGEDGDEKEAAVYLLGRVKWYIDWMNRKAKEKYEEGRPKAGLEYLQTLSKQFKGHSVGDQAEAQHTAKKTDDKYKDKLRTLHKTYPWYHFDRRPILYANQKYIRDLLAPAKTLHAYFNSCALSDAIFPRPAACSTVSPY